jgi:hypothetical protein
VPCKRRSIGVRRRRTPRNVLPHHIVIESLEEFIDIPFEVDVGEIDDAP